MVLVGYIYDICTLNPTCTKNFRKLGYKEIITLIKVWKLTNIM